MEIEITSEEIKEARRLLIENPGMKFYEAMRQAKEMHKKDPQDCNPEGA